jgi:SAM-dependent methyltransferase
MVVRNFASLVGVAAALVGLLAAEVWREDGEHTIAPPPDRANKAMLPAAADEYLWTEDSASSAGEWLSAVDRSLKSLPAHSMVIDLGCGNGLLLSRFRARGWHLVGIDSSQSGVQIARKKYPDIRFESADATDDLSFVGYGSFDAVISTDVIEHIFLPRKYVANCFKVLKPGGTLVITTPYHGYAKNLAIALTNRWDSHLQPLQDFGHIKFWSVDSLSALLFDAGFQRISWQGLGRVSHLWKDMLFTAHKPELGPTERGK